MGLIDRLRVLIGGKNDTPGDDKTESENSVKSTNDDFVEKYQAKTSTPKTPMVLFYSINSKDIELPEDYFQDIIHNRLGYTVKYKEIPGKGYRVQSEAMSPEDNRKMIDNLLTRITYVASIYTDYEEGKNEKLIEEYRAMCHKINSYLDIDRYKRSKDTSYNSLELYQRALCYTVWCFDSLRSTFENGNVSDKTTFNANENYKKVTEFFRKREPDFQERE